MDTFVCINREDGIVLTPSKILGDYDYLWDNGVQDTVLKAYHNGIYWVAYNNGCHYRIDSFLLNGDDLLPPEISVKLNELGTTIPYATYQ